MACKNCNACQSGASLTRLFVRMLVDALTLFVGLLNSGKALIATKIDGIKAKKKKRL